MKLLIENGRIIGTATDAYTGPMAFETAPAGFDHERIEEYQKLNGEWVIPVLVPASITKRQGRQQMILMGIIDQVQTAIDAIPDPTQKALVQSFWDDSAKYERNHPQMIQLAEIIGLTSEQLDQAFIEAAKL